MERIREARTEREHAPSDGKEMPTEEKTIYEEAYTITDYPDPLQKNATDVYTTTYE